MSYIDLSCPTEIFRTALPTEEIPAATVTLFNLSDRVISSVEVSLRLLDAAGGELERLSFRGRALNGRPHSTFLLTVPCAPSTELRALDVSVEKVWYADNDTWRRNPANVVEYLPNTLPVSPALTNLKYAAGETAVGYPSMQNGLWVCVCGRPNPAAEAYCARCGRQMELIFARFSPEAVEAQISMKERQLDLSSRNMREDTIRLQRIREEEYIQKKARRGSRLRIAAGMAAAVVLTACALFFVSPWLRMSAGRKALEAGDAAGAKAAFQALGSFSGADELIAECDWRLALGAAENGNSAEDLERASAMLRAVSDRPEALEKANETDLLRTRLLLGNGQWSEALDAMALVPEDYTGKAELEQDCLMAKAFALQSRGEYAAAREVLLSLGVYPGARDQAALCVYEPAKALIKKKDWDGAIALLSEIPDYLDSRDLTLECHYRKAEAMLKAGDKEGASDEFLLAGNWSDAPERCKSLTYERAEALYKAKDIQGAQPLYASIPDYRDSNQKDQACRYAMAKAAADELEYSRALELLKGIPDSYEKTKSIRAEASYRKAKTAMSKKDWATAVELLGSLDRNSLLKKYKDIETMYLQACKKAGVDPYPETPSPTPKPTKTPAPAAKRTPVPEEKVIVLSPDPFLVTDEDEQP